MGLGPNDKEQYTAQDIERYYNGQMPAPERHALEKAALDDPFLADALEGYKLTPTPAADMAALKKELAHKTDKAKVVPIAATQRRSSSWFRIAALFLVLMGAGWSVYYLMDAKRDTLALDNKESAAPVTLQAPAATPDTTPGQPAAPPPGPQLTFARPEPVKETNATAQKKDESRMEDQQPGEVANMQPAAATAVAQAPVLWRADTAPDNVAIVQRQLQGKAAGIQSRTANAINSFSGRVVDAQNQGIPSASVVIRNSNAITTTDQKGYFSLSTPDTAVTASVEAAGFESKDITLNNRNSDNNIVLQEGNQSLQEVVVTGVGPRRKRSAAGTGRSPALSEPAEGWPYFQNYVAKNRMELKGADGSRATGAVTLTFTVNRQGTPTNIKVEESSSPALHAEATRLLKEGPKWDRKKGTKGRVTIHLE